MNTDIEPRSMRALVVDDEPLARELLQKLLQKMPSISVVAVAANGPAAVQAIRQHRPDVVFLDVQMPGLTGIDVVREIGQEHMPATVFVTAYDQYAIKAFEVAAVDYLLKPLADARLADAVTRVRQAIAAKQSRQLATQMQTLLRLFNAPHGESSQETLMVTERSYLERIAVELRGQVRTIPVTQIDYITVSGVYADLHVGDKSYPLRERMQTLEEGLNPAQFLRIHRSAIVQLDRIDVLIRQSGSDYTLRLKNGVQLAVARTKVKELERWMGVISAAHGP